MSTQLQDKSFNIVYKQDFIDTLGLPFQSHTIQVCIKCARSVDNIFKVNEEVIPPTPGP